MEGDTRNFHPEGCKCEKCCGRCFTCGGYHHWAGGHWLWRALVAAIILTITFWCGVKIGEIKGYVEANYGGYGMQYGRMMWGYAPAYYYIVPSSGTSATSTKK
ncbi:MAG: hypothetical protein KGJ01_00575 [Patescibacteria group bacterium]|nr:hypothetical protein [Patescibacteria group bacterium]